MKFTAYTFALSDFLATGLVLLIVCVPFVMLGAWVVDMFNLDPCDHLEESESDPEFEQESTEIIALCDKSRLEETGIAAEIAHLPPGSQLVEIDTAGLLTPPGAVMVHEYRWTGSQIEFVRTCPLHEFDFVVRSGDASSPDSHADDSSALHKTPFEFVGHRAWPELKAARTAALN